MKVREYIGAAVAALVMAVVLIACGTPQTIDAGHSATISCGSDGMVHAAAAQYNGGEYSLNGMEAVSFQSGFAFPLDGTKAWTIVVTADDWPTFTGSAGPCTQPGTTTTICVDCVPNTNVTVPDPTTTTTTVPATTTTICVDCVPNTQAAPTTTSTTLVTPPPGVTTTSIVIPPSGATTTVPRAATATTTRPSAPPGALPPTR